MDEENQITTDEAALAEELEIFGESRRRFLGQAAAVGLGAIALQVLLEEQNFAAFDLVEMKSLATDVPIENAISVRLKINNVEKTLSLDSRVTLLDALREYVGLTGSKKGCDHGQCGACTVIVDGRRVLSCLTLTAQCEDKEITTIEGLANGNQLHPVQASFLKHDSFQCGFCTPGQICSAVALLNEARNGEASYVTADVRQKTGRLELSDEEIRERMSGNLCRCGAYPNIVTAIKEAHSGKLIDEQAWKFVESEREDKDAPV